MVDHTYEWVEFNVEECVFFFKSIPYGAGLWDRSFKHEHLYDIQRSI